MKQKFIKNSERNVSKEPGSFVLTKHGKLEKNLKDEAMRKREEKNKDAVLKEATEVTTEAKTETKTENKTEE